VLTSPGARPRTVPELIVLLLVLVACAALLAPAGTAGAAGASARTVQHFGLVSHRGFTSSTVTENTLKAFRNAARNGARAVEVDIRLSKNHFFIAMHDASLRRTTTCDGLVSSRTMGDIQKNCRGRRSRELVPNLGMVLRWAANNSKRVFVELKPSDWTRNDFARLVSVVRQSRAASRVVYLSFDPAKLQAVRAVDPGADVHLIAETAAQIKTHRPWVDGVHVWPAVVSRTAVAGLHADGITVVGRSTNNATTWQKFRTLGVDGVLTDHLKRYTRWLRARR
jgi:glycerophosphoryl diester phosphodiesterase